MNKYYHLRQKKQLNKEKQRHNILMKLFRGLFQ